jgi:ABC-type sugar transport system ATPase subunit
MTIASDRAPNVVRARVSVVEPLGSHKLITAQVGTETVKVTVPADQAVVPHQEVWLTLDANKLRWMDAATGQAI